MKTAILDNIVALAQADENIRAVILEGSLAAGFQVDEFSDYDINIYAKEFDRYLKDDRWMSQVGEILLYQKEAFDFYGTTIPTRLVLFRDRNRVDFSFWHLDLLVEMVQGLKRYESYRNGYRVLVDKDHLAERLKPPDFAGFQIAPPGRDRFRQTLYDFWFEAYGVAKYLARKDLWYAKLVENGSIKDHLFRMALWHHLAANQWRPNPLIHSAGKRFERWASPELIRKIKQCFSGYGFDETWASIFAMVELFNAIARQIAHQLQIPYPEQVESDILYLIRYLQQCGASQPASPKLPG